MALPNIGTKRTKVLIISDTHTATPYPAGDTEHAFRWPFPKVDILLHCGDLTGNGALYQHERTVDMLKNIPAKLKIVIPGNHDITLDEKYYKQDWKLHGRASGKQDTDACRALYTSIEAEEAGLVYMEEGLRNFNVNGAKLTIYASAYTPEFCQWGFAYERNEDRFNPADPGASYQPANPIPDHGQIDIMVTHGPPSGILDATKQSMNVGCENLFNAVRRCKPRLHAFGHIHEAWGAVRMDWGSKKLREVDLPEFDEYGKNDEIVREGAAFVDISNGGEDPLEFGKETLFVNASIMDLLYDPTNAPFVVDLDLPLAVS